MHEEQTVSKTDAGRQLGEELANGEHRNERARDWQVGLALNGAEEHYSRLEDYMEWLEGKEARGILRALGGTR